MELSTLSEIQYAQFLAGDIPQLVRLRAGVWCLALPFRPQVPYTLTYIIEDPVRGFHVIDPGSDMAENRLLIAEALESLGGSVSQVRSIIVTHMHNDHIGSAAWLSKQSEAAVWMSEIDAIDLRAGSANTRYTGDVSRLGDLWGVPESMRENLVPLGYDARDTAIPERIRFVADGELLDIGGRAVRAVHTPGHTGGHMCYALEEDSLILTGDHLLPHIQPPIGKDGSDGHTAVKDFLGSLEKLQVYDHYDVGPGHGFCFRGLALRRKSVRERVLARARETEETLCKNPKASVWEIASQLRWGPGWQNLTGILLQSALAQTQMYADFVHADTGLTDRGECMTQLQDL